jgi:hypothetical protein
VFDTSDADWKLCLRELDRLNHVLNRPITLEEFLSDNDSQLKQLQSRLNMLSDHNQTSN